MGASRKMIDVVDALIKAGWLQHYEGYYNRLGKKGGDTRKNVWSRLAILQPMADFIQRHNLLSIPTPAHEDRPLIFLNNKDASEEETPCLQPAKPKTMPTHVRQSEKVLERYNAFLSQQSLGLSCDTTGVFLDTTQVYRVFNRNSYDHGGRIYGGWWMQLNKDKRSHITINGQPTIELDYKGQHPNLLYAQANIPLPADPYDIPDLPRKLAKTATMVMLNSDSPQKAFQALHHENVHQIEDIEAELDGEWMYTYEVYEYRNDYLPTYKQFEEQVAAPILAKHKPIAERFYTDQGTLLMNLDARICLYVLEHMTARGIGMSQFVAVPCSFCYKVWLRPVQSS